MVSKYIQYSSLDTNIWVDRAANTVADLELYVEIPDGIKYGEQVNLHIINYDSTYNYEISAKYGNVNHQGAVIIYYSPTYAFNGDDVLTIKVTAPPKTITYFPATSTHSDYFYEASGRFHYVDEYMSASYADTAIIEYLNRIRDNRVIDNSDSYADRVNIDSIYDYSENSSNGNNFDIHAMFPEYAHQQRSWKDDGIPSGGFEEYHNPSNIDIQSDFLPGIYQVETRKDGFRYVTFKPRNSNIDEAQGNVLTGFRSPGSIGGALMVSNTEDHISKTFEYEIPIDIYDLEAVLPDEILSLCISSIEIVPILRGVEDGHTFEWEQIKGDESEVVWISEKTDKELIINIGKIKTDRVFRFWISRGTKHERKYDVTIYGTPKDQIQGLPNAQDIFSLSGNNLNLSSHDTKPILLTSERIWVKEMRVRFVEKVR